MRFISFILSTLLLALSSNGYSSIIYFTDIVSFNDSTQTTLIEDFEDISPKDRSLQSFSSAGITYSPFSSGNVWVSSPGYTNYGVPVTTSSILTANGYEDYILNFSNPFTAIGFDTYLNRFGPASISIFGANGLLDTFTLSHDPTIVGFFGLAASESITAIRWNTVNGGAINTGIDNIRVGGVDTTTAVSEPTAALLLALAIPCLLRSRRQSRKSS